MFEFILLISFLFIIINIFYLMSRSFKEFTLHILDVRSPTANLIMILLMIPIINILLVLSFIIQKLLK